MIIYQTEDGQTRLQVKMEDETVWLTQEQMAELFDKGRTTIIEHIQNVFKENELVKKSVCRGLQALKALTSLLKMPKSQKTISLK